MFFVEDRFKLRSSMGGGMNSFGHCGLAMAMRQARIR